MRYLVGLRFHALLAWLLLVVPRGDKRTGFHSVELRRFCVLLPWLYLVSVRCIHTGEWCEAFDLRLIRSFCEFGIGTAGLDFPFYRDTGLGFLAVADAAFLFGNFLTGLITGLTLAF